MSDLFTPKVKASAVDYIVNQIKNLLITGKIKPGDKLPTEQEIADGLGVSRGSVRSAMKVFEAVGVIEIKVGDGTYVCTSLNSKSFNPMMFSLLILNPSLPMLSQFREKVEFDIIELIMNNKELSQKIIPLLEKNLEDFRKLQENDATTREEFAENDKQFHHILSSSCDNVIFQTVYDYIFEFFFPHITDSHYRQSHGMVAGAVHKKIFEAIKTGDIALARVAVEEAVVAWYSLIV